jgi:hypothetical protein
MKSMDHDDGGGRGNGLEATVWNCVLVVPVSRDGEGA